jgi:hypothetical protein
LLGINTTDKPLTHGLNEEFVHEGNIPPIRNTNHHTFSPGEHCCGGRNNFSITREVSPFHPVRKLPPGTCAGREHLVQRIELVKARVVGGAGK